MYIHKYTHTYSCIYIRINFQLKDNCHTRVLNANRNVCTCAPEQTFKSNPRESTPIRLPPVLIAMRSNYLQQRLKPPHIHIRSQHTCNMHERRLQKGFFTHDTIVSLTHMIMNTFNNVNQLFNSPFPSVPNQYFGYHYV